ARARARAVATPHRQRHHAGGLSALGLIMVGSALTSWDRPDDLRISCKRPARSCSNSVAFSTSDVGTFETMRLTVTDAPSALTTCGRRLIVRAVDSGPPVPASRLQGNYFRCPDFFDGQLEQRPNLSADHCSRTVLGQRQRDVRRAGTARQPHYLVRATSVGAR